MNSIAYLESEISTAFANKQKVLAIFFDIEKAYDMTWRDNILTSLVKPEFKDNIAHYINTFIQTVMALFALTTSFRTFP